MAVLFLYRDLLYRKFGFPSGFTWISPILVLLIFCNEQLLGLIRNNNEPFYFLTFGIGKTIIELGMAVLLILFFKYHWQGRVIGISTAYFTVTIFAFIYFFKKGYLGGKIKIEFLKSELIYALPIIMLQLSIFVMSSSDKFFLAGNHEVVGIYGIACTFSSIILILGTGLLQYIFPKIFSLLSASNVDYASIRKHFYLYAIVMAIGAIAVLLFTQLFYTFFINVKYYTALKYIYFIVLGYFFWTITYFFYCFLLYNKQKRQILFLSVLSITISLGCNSFFIPRLGDAGAAIAVCCCYLLMLCCTVWVTRPYWKLFFKNDL
ncbi:polysaccharide biosynthesis C-terminal domain-containing protein [Ferruginibacter sp.]|uniref:polysaccharide biosynthesis C-terminal domain-containing protein n=1 Tax=Ferruginibacter sp. TaxID=1940288 RepID=UPI001999EEE8|nr:polysaccharide biosynthesis C-terminal domain-containing protein [Ferruginibacter sp.]MBC7627765.1 polysaccharide biosynthesis C-terminal domain-containing protein [Ferruginibacter sp.]